MRYGGFLLALGFVLFAAVSAILWISAEPERPERGVGVVGNAQRGAYVLRLSGCVSCHTDTARGGGFLAGGGALESDFGTLYAPNITTHKRDGIGDWTQADFFAAMTYGESPHGYPYYPAFPYAFYTRLSDQDIADLWAALRRVAPLPGTTADNSLRFPYYLRIFLRPWQWMFFEHGARAAPDGAPQWQRGYELVTGPGHCGACHTPRNFLGARKQRQALTGTRLGGERVPDISAEALQRDGWSQEDIVFALQTGVTPSGDVLGGSMGEVVRESTSYLNRSDLEAIAAYLLASP